MIRLLQMADMKVLVGDTKRQGDEHLRCVKWCYDLTVV